MSPTNRPERQFHRPIWDRGEEIDGEMLAFTIGDDWQQDQRLVAVDVRGSIAHANGLERAGLIQPDDAARIRQGLASLLREHAAGAWALEPADEDVHSAIERRLVERIGEAGKRLHTGRSRNDQVAVDVRLWLREAIEATQTRGDAVVAALDESIASHGSLPLPGYTHLRRAMPSTLGDWAGAHRAAFAASLRDLDGARARIRHCPLGSGAGYGVPLALDREGVAHELGFEGPEEPVTATQHTRGRAELAYVTALEGIALDLGKLCADLWLFTTSEFGFATLPTALTTGSSLMPHKRNPDLLELLRAHGRQVVSDRTALLDLLRDLPLGYHRDFQLLKPPLFRAHDRVAQMLPLVARLIPTVEWNELALREAGEDPGLHATSRALERAARGEAFRDAYRDESLRSGRDRPGRDATETEQPASEIGDSGGRNSGAS